MESRAVLERLAGSIELFDIMYPPVGGLKKTPSGHEAECYYIAVWIRRLLLRYPNHAVNAASLKRACYMEIGFVSSRRIELIVDGLMKPL